MNKCYIKQSFLLACLLVVTTAIVNAQTTTTDPSPYCGTSYTNGAGSSCSVNDMIDNFTFNTLSNLNSGCTPPSAGSPLGDYMYYLAASGKTTTVVPGSTYTMTVQGRVSAAKPNGYAVWIDYNRNGSLTDPGEMVYFTPGAAGSLSTATLYTASITIPPSATPGVTRLRVRGNWSNWGGPFVLSDGCGAYSPVATGWGETEDYDITIFGSGAPVTIPPIASFAYNHADTILSLIHI